MSSQKTDEHLKNIYLNLKHPTSFTSKKNLYLEAKKLGISKEAVDTFLQKHEAYYTHRPARKKFGYKKMTGSSLFSHVQADIKDLNAFKSLNNGYRYFLLAIDCYSRKVFCEPLKQKTPDAVLNAFRKMFTENQFYPYFLLTDAGTEFFNKKMTDFCKQNQIVQVPLRSNPAKAAIAERAIQTITTRMARAMTFRNSNKWTDFLDQTVKNYNNSEHSAIKMKPVDVKFTTRLNITPPKIKKKSKYIVGDIVCLSKYRGVFDKAYLGKWGKELFKIEEIVNGAPVVFRLCDLNGEKIDGHFYEQEIQKVCNENNVFHVEKILDKKTIRGKKYVLVRWMNYGPAFDSWEPAENVIIL